MVSMMMKLSRSAGPLSPGLSKRQLATLLERIPEWKNHFPELSFSATYTAKQLGLPRCNFQTLVDFQRYEECQLHALCMKMYQKLWELNSVEEFMEVFIDCLECHYHAYTTGKALHRDLSENNLMFKRREERPCGILNDWDLTSLLDHAGEVPVSNARHRTGTLPFMAFDLLEKPPPPHLYRHDLESFFYILVWAAIHYDFKKKCRRNTPRELKLWNKAADDVRAEKWSFLTDVVARDQIFAYIRKEFHGLRDQWLLPLSDLFYHGHISSNMNRRSPIPGYDNATLGGLITFDTFMAAIRRTPRKFPSTIARAP